MICSIEKLNKNRRRANSSSAIIKTRQLIAVICFVVLITAFCPAMPAMAAEQHYVVDNEWQIPIPLTYRTVDVIEYLGEKGNFLNGAEDMFLYNDSFLFVADTQNNRILKLTLDGTAVGVFNGPQGKTLNNPKGIYVDKDGDMYIADTGNKRIIHLSADGAFIEEFIRPESKLLNDDFIFDPSKVYINTTGYLYAIKSQAFLSMDGNNQFRGYIGSTKVDFNFQRMLIRMFATESQKNRVEKQLPDSYSNFVIDDSGIIYATVINAKSGQIKKITSAGKNIYPEKFYGEMSKRGLDAKLPNLVDIAVDKNSIISVIDQSSGKIYQYDQEGNMLTAFGGIGSTKGMFKIPSSMVADSDGRIYVLDQEANNIQVFEPTKFIRLVHEATVLYSEGSYAKSREVWEEVLKTDAKYSLAHRGIAKALLKEEKWQESMDKYKLANDKVGYSEAFTQLRHDIFRSYLGWVVLGILVFAVGLIYLLKFIKKLAKDSIRRNMGW